MSDGSGPLLTIGYSVLASAQEHIRFPAPRPDIEIVMVVQDGDLEHVRADVLAHRHSGIGVAQSRNEILRRARGRYLLFADDDIELDLDEIDKALGVLNDHPEIGITLGQSQDGYGRPRKRPITKRRPLTIRRAAKAATFEIIVRLEAVRSTGIEFDHRFGAGVEWYLGDEFIFLADLLRAGVRGLEVPATFATHADESSGHRAGGAREAEARAAVLGRVYGQHAWLSRVLFLLRRPTRFGSLKHSLTFLQSPTKSATGRINP